MRLFELVGTPEVVELERQLDKMFRPLGLDVEFSRHFTQRLLGRDKAVTIDEVTASFDKMKKKYKKRLISAKKKSDYEGILRDFGNDLNVVFGINGDQLDAITIMRKNPNNFHTNTQKGDDLRVK